MKLTTVLGSVNMNKEYYMFVPKQISFWKLFGINFIAIIIGDGIPDELKEYSDNNTDDNQKTPSTITEEKLETSIEICQRKLILLETISTSLNNFSIKFNSSTDPTQLDNTSNAMSNRLLSRPNWFA